MPQRCVSLDGSANSGVTRPALPSSNKKPKGFQQKLKQQQQPHQGSLPNFNASKEDMVLPQPVYMNMSDLAALAVQKAQQQHMQLHPTIEEESPDLKTPTAEELQMIPGAAPKVSSFLKRYLRLFTFSFFRSLFPESMATAEVRPVTAQSARQADTEVKALCALRSSNSKTTKL